MANYTCDLFTSSYSYLEGSRTGPQLTAEQYSGVSSTITYHNKCVDQVTGVWVYWTSTGAADSTGSSYPGTSFDSASYSVQTKITS